MGGSCSSGAVSGASLELFPSGETPSLQKNPDQERNVRQGEEEDQSKRGACIRCSPWPPSERRSPLPHPGHGDTSDPSLLPPRAQPGWFGGPHPFVPNAPSPEGRARHGRSSPADNGDIVRQNQSNNAESRPLFWELICCKANVICV